MAIFNEENIKKLSKDKPVVYALKKNGKVVYVGSAKRGEVQNRLSSHFRNKNIDANQFSVQKKPSIKEAREYEKNQIQKKKPRYNKQHKK